MFLNSSGLKSVFEKFHFCDGIVWTVGLTVETKLRFKFLRSSVDGAQVFSYILILTHFCTFSLLQNLRQVQVSVVNAIVDIDTT